MKRKLTALLIAMMIGCSALAESPAPIPAPEIIEDAQTSGSMSITVNDKPLTLEFDPDPQYSICRDGYVQASFFVYGESGQLYELYMTFPQSVQSGQTVTPQSSLQRADIFSGIYLYTSTDTSETCSAATQFLTGAYPENSNYTLTFDAVSVNNSIASFSGTIQAELVQLDPSYNPTSIVESLNGSFSFSMDLGSASAQPEPRQPESGESPSAPETAPEKDDSENKIPDSQPEEFDIPYPPTPPKKLITPSNAQKI